MSEPVRAYRRTLVALVAIVVLGCGLAASTWHVFGHTWDEPEHIAAGMALVDRGRYVYDIQHPPIARVMLAVGPYLAGARSQGSRPPDGKPEGIAILYGSGHYDLYLTLARAGALPFFALLIVMTFLWGRRLLGDPGGLLAAALLATTPAILGHAGIATLDIAAAATCVLALYLGERWLASGRRRDAIWLGLATGLAIGCKLSAIPYLGLGAIALIGARLWERRGRGDARPPVSPAAWSGGVVIVIALVVVVLTLAYSGRFVYLTDKTFGYNHAIDYLFAYSKPKHDAAEQFFRQWPVPEAFPLLLGGIEALVVHNHSGHLSYLFGELRTTGWWYFYMVALLVKTPLPLLAMGLAGQGLLVQDGLRNRDAALLAPVLLTFAILLFASLFSHINIGIRHVLVLYPFLAISAAYACVVTVRAAPQGAGLRYAMLGVALALAAEGAIVVRTWPDYLAYFNVLAPEPEHVLVDSDLDWGQDLQRLSRRLAELKVPAVSLAYLGTAQLPLEHLPPYTLLGPDQRATGWIAVTALARVHAPERFAWLDAYPRREQVGQSIDLYYVPPAAR